MPENYIPFELEVEGSVPEKNKKKLEIHDKIFISVVAVLVVQVVMMLIMVGTLIVDSFHFNSAVYREYSAELQENNLRLENIENSQEALNIIDERLSELEENE